MFLVILRPVEETHYNHFFIIGNFGIIYVPAFTHEGKVFFGCTPFEIFVCFKVTLNVFNNRGCRCGFCFPCVGFPQVFDDFTKVRQYDVPEKRVCIWIVAIPLTYISMSAMYFSKAGCLIISHSRRWLKCLFLRNSTVSSSSFSTDRSASAVFLVSVIPSR